MNIQTYEEFWGLKNFLILIPYCSGLKAHYGRTNTDQRRGATAVRYPELHSKIRLFCRVFLHKLPCPFPLRSNQPLFLYCGTTQNPVFDHHHFKDVITLEWELCRGGGTVGKTRARFLACFYGACRGAPEHARSPSPGDSVEYPFAGLGRVKSAKFTSPP